LHFQAAARLTGTRLAVVTFRQGKGSP